MPAIVMVVIVAAVSLALADRGRPVGGVGTAAHSGRGAHRLSVGDGHGDIGRRRRFGGELWTHGVGRVRSAPGHRGRRNDGETRGRIPMGLCAYGATRNPNRVRTRLIAYVRLAATRS